ncbi:hypothetical protein CEUSTIGMA_g10050.t1 [Chlamydomonas eustigma]|uniref:Uncharacterized protein n=1 Tax=Chlamydomonas eustigma TaxID=1157962 RepID=A0A250XHS3_9CHLO|nr:hypothetical protein CEUSTIGMA_g10050.t1 [Chlamydomonas eustigma]|eukprot:GAX82624.1 hypothetical protein CEUSTIGMA_g10050.t1 [Chlamydomonas eustigma]
MVLERISLYELFTGECDNCYLVSYAMSQSSYPQGPAWNADSIYKDFFATVGSKPNETYESLLNLLPSVRDISKEECVLPISSERAQDAPGIHPLQQDWLDAKEEDDDLPVEEGDWVDVQEVVDEEGIPVQSAISRSSSGCILDGPGAVQVDNFTADEEAGNMDTQQAFVFSYLPSALGKVTVADVEHPGLPLSGPSQLSLASSSCPMRHNRNPIMLRTPQTQFTSNKVTGNSLCLDGSFGGAVVTLEDQIKAMRGLLNRSVGPSHHLLSAGGTVLPDVENGSDDEMEIELLSEGREQGHENVASIRGDIGDEDLISTVNEVNRSATTSHEGNQIVTLPGECLLSDISRQAQDTDDEETPATALTQLSHPTTTVSCHSVSDGLPSAKDVDTMKSDSATTRVSSTALPSTSPSPSSSQPGVFYESVEGFSLDPDFDYDNVKLTPREYPYNQRASAPFPFRK